MSPLPTGSVLGLLAKKTHRLATLWQIDRVDGVIIRVTDHNSPIIFEGNTFGSAGGFDASARRKQAGMRLQSMDIRGVLLSSKITQDDLRAGRYREAQITETVVDWKYPFAGAILKNIYWIMDTRFDEEFWTATVEGMLRWFTPPVGEIYEKTCRYTLGDARCTVDLGPLTVAAAIADVTTVGLDKRLKFRVDALTDADGVYDDGKMTFTSGANNGLILEVQLWTLAAKDIVLYLPTPFDLVVGDTFNIVPGCDKLKTTCDTKFTNLPFFGGFPFIPGNDRMLQTPKAKTG